MQMGAKDERGFRLCEIIERGIVLGLHAYLRLLRFRFGVFLKDREQVSLIKIRSELPCADILFPFRVQIAETAAADPKCDPVICKQSIPEFFQAFCVRRCRIDSIADLLQFHLKVFTSGFLLFTLRFAILTLGDLHGSRGEQIDLVQTFALGDFHQTLLHGRQQLARLMMLEACAAVVRSLHEILPLHVKFA